MNENTYEFVVYISKEDGTSVPVELFRGLDITDFEIQTGMFQPGYKITIEQQKI